jgi:GntR family transcriptional regulator
LEATVQAADRFVPNYSRVEQYLRKRVRSGELRPGDPIPPESQLVQQFGISRMTVRQALARLVYQGIITRQRGRGSYVAEPRLEHTQMFLSFEEEMRARGSRIAHRLISRRSEAADGEVAESLAVPEGTPIIVLERLRYVDGRIVGYEIRYLPEKIGKALTEDEIRNQPLVPAVRRILGKGRTRLRLRVTSAAVRAREARLLELKTGAPVLIRENTWFVEPEGPIQYGKSIFRGDRYQMMVEFRSSPSREMEL